MIWIVVLVFVLGVAVGAVGTIALAWEAGRVATALRKGVPW